MSESNVQESVNQSSLRISELPQLDSVKNDSYLVVECKDGSNKQSFKIKYSALKNQIYDSLDDLYHLGSMAYCDKDDFAKLAHGHDYSDIRFFPSYGPNSNNPTYKNEICCDVYGTASISSYLAGTASTSKTVKICGPKAKQTIIDDTASLKLKLPGDLQMLAISQPFENYLTSYRKYSLIDINGKRNIDIMADTFDGYVIPNGTTYNCKASEFKDACKLYSTSKNENATSFTVPTLDKFFKCNPGVQTTNALSVVPFQTGISSHSHLSIINDAGSGSEGITKLSLEFGDFYQYSSATPNSIDPKKYAKSFLHGGNSDIASRSSIISVYGYHVDIDIGNFQSKTTQNPSEESYPNYNNVPVLLYIGGK